MAGLGSLNRKARKAVGKSLEPDEEVLIAESGEYGALVATSKRIFVCKWGITSGAFFASQINSWDLRNVSGIEYRKGMTTKAIVVQAPGTVPVGKFGRMDKGPGSVWEAPNALFVSNPVDDSVAKLRRLIADHQSPGPRAPMASSDPAEQIRSLAALREEGLLTPDEFEAKKRQILGI